MGHASLYYRMFSLGLALWPVGLIFAQDGWIKGKVTNGAEHLPAATVRLGHLTQLTDHQGEFSFSAKSGKYILIISHTGYSKIEETISIQPGETRQLSILLTPSGQLGEVVLLGSRSNIQRSNLNSAVPVDALTSAHLAQTGQISPTQMLNFLAPSFNVSREVLNEPATLRGLDPQHVLITLNGLRYHNMAWLFNGGLRGQLGRGSVGNDLNSIPFAAIEKLEILRDGAVAQYGSDAIAGVMNIQLKKTTGKTAVQLHTGQYYAGDGEKISLGINRGFSLNKKGFINLSGTFRFQAPTFRGGEYLGTVYYDTTNVRPTLKDSLLAADHDTVVARGFNRQATGDNIGNSRLLSAGLVLNGGYDFARSTSVFWSAVWNNRKMERSSAFRFPKHLSQVNTALYPDGFQAMSKPTSADLSFIGGIKGKTRNHWDWDFRSGFGSNTFSSFITNTNNASQFYLGEKAPTSFYGGGHIYKLLTNNINVSRSKFKLPGQWSSLNLDWGLEWRLEQYQLTAGDEASWKNYDLSGVRQGGSQGNAGNSPDNAVNATRHVWASYLEAETELSARLLLNASGRYEYYSDFGGNLAGKLAARYRLSDKFSLRASLSNGFRAPSLQQQYQNGIQTTFRNVGGVLIPSIRGAFPNNHAVVKAFGIPALTPEQSVNMGAGITSSLSKSIRFTVDAYWIEITNRIVLSSLLDRSIPDVRKILDKIPGTRVDQVQFFTNAVNTRTKGIDLVLDGHWKIRKNHLSVSLAANVNSTRLFGTVQTSPKLPADSLNMDAIFNIEERTRMEKGQPESKVILSATYGMRKVKVMVRNTRFGSTTIAPVYRNPPRVLYESFSSKILTDISITYSPTQWADFTLGANNIFDVYPDPLKCMENTAEGIWIYSPEASPFAFNGGYYYLGMGFNF